MSRDDHRVAVIGYGLAGAVFHAPLIAATPGLRVATVVTGNANRAEQARREHPGVQVLDRAERLWELAAEHELVVVAAPNRAHVPLALAAIDAGLPVVVDKPLAPSLAEGRRLEAAAASAGSIVAVFHNRRWDGDFLTVRRLLEQDALGGVVRFESRFERWRPQLKEGAWRELGDPEEAGGLLFDLGSHLVDQALVLFGRPVSVYAEVERRRAGAAVDDDTFVALEHEGGARSHLWASSVAALPQARLRVLGLAGAYVKDGLDGQEDALRAGARPGDEGWGIEPRERWGRLADEGGEAQEVETEPGAYERFYEGVERSLSEGVPPPVGLVEGLAVLEVLEAARESAGAGAVVPLG